MAKIDAYLSLLQNNTGDIIIQEGLAPVFRAVQGYKSAGADVVQSGALMPVVQEILGKIEAERLAVDGHVNTIYQAEDGHRYRMAIMRNFDGMAIVCRHLPREAPTLQNLKVPEAIIKLSALRTGLVLVATPVGGGLSTLLTAMVEYINSRRVTRILVMDENGELTFKSKKATVVTVGLDEHGVYAPTLREAAEKSGYNVIVLAHPLTPEWAEWALSRSESGQFVIVACQGGTVQQVISSFCGPSVEDPFFMNRLSTHLRGVIVQKLFANCNNQSIICAHEIALVNKAVSKIIREGQLDGLLQLMQAGHAQGMSTLDESLEKLLSSGDIDAETAYAQATDKSRFKRGGV